MDPDNVIVASRYILRCIAMGHWLISEDVVRTMPMDIKTRNRLTGQRRITERNVDVD